MEPAQLMPVTALAIAFVRPIMTMAKQSVIAAAEIGNLNHGLPTVLARSAQKLAAQAEGHHQLHLVL